MTELRGKQRTDHNDLFDLAPDLAFEKRVTIPLCAGDCTFHNANLAHSATPNYTDEPRVARVMAYVDVETNAGGRLGGRVVSVGEFRGWRACLPTGNDSFFKRHGTEGL